MFVARLLAFVALAPAALGIALGVCRVLERPLVHTPPPAVASAPAAPLRASGPTPTYARMAPRRTVRMAAGRMAAGR
jgi:hypothetical protein